MLFHKQFLHYSGLILFIGLLNNLKAQESINSAGGEASGNGGIVSYSVGQMAYSTNQGTSGSTVQGVQQPYEISIVIGVEQTTKMNISISLFPNPTTDYLMLKVENLEMKNVIWQLFNIDGKLLKSKKLSKSETIIKTDKLVPSIYFLKLIQENKILSEFKIIKN